MKRFFSCILAAIIVWGSVAIAEGSDMRMNTILVDFSVRSGVPLIKKFGLFNSGLVSLRQYQQYASYMDKLRTDSLRIDLFMGSRSEPMGQMIMGSADQLKYDFAPLDTILDILDEKGSKLYASWCYIPVPLQKNNNWRSGPTDINAWQEMFKQISAYYKEKGIRIPYNEIYNEPDCNGVFFTGSFSDYTRMYLSAVRGIKDGNSDAVVGGPSSAFVENSVPGINGFLQAVLSENAPLDFFSYHSYGCDAKQYIARTKLAREMLYSHPEFDATELHLNEFNSLIQPFVPDGPAEHARGGATMLTAFQLLLEETDVTLANWAQWLDTGIEPLGSVDIYGKAKAAFWTYWMYSSMPEERVLVEGIKDEMQEGIHAMASADQNQAAILIWNDHKTETEQLTLQLKHLPSFDGSMRVYSINDDNGYPYATDDHGDLIPDAVIPISECKDEMALTLKPGEVVFCLFNGSQQDTAAQAPGELIRKRYFFTERGKKNYAFYDETDPKVYLGMNGEVVGRSTVAIECDHLPNMLIVNSKMHGGYETIDQNSAFTIRVDYEANGSYTKSCIWSFMPMNVRRSNAFPWGTQKEADETLVESSLLTGKSLLMLQNHAPKDWSGRAIITFDMQDAGKNCGTEIQIVPVL